ncbi:hypothetical protein [Caulobacter mirabilis]|uniref:Uncharacterized protein n=1 Tax=Caulobacter mirabilis TaxID=69666 RepID=A0A2D2AVP4_9CAUL|nr:hypothetical protein [Caulobacter mirabilis]ATQ42074.1 hypothetical protein CSW64_06405 [Caulobacter mirabilis]
MKPRIAIGITTYLDLSDVAFGAAVYDALVAASNRLAPDKGNVMGMRCEIASRQDFVDRWMSRLPFETRENRGRGPVIDRGEYVVGLQWRSRGGNGRVNFRAPSSDPNADCTLTLDLAWAARTDWAGLFDRLVEITSPSHAMLHLFTPAEIDAHPRGDPHDDFDGPVVGEGTFTAWLSSIGDWRRPDRHRPEERRRYRFLPQLSWANVLGKEFDGCYDPEAIRALGQDTRSVGDGLGFRVTGALADVERDPDAFAAARARLRGAFAPDVFRR